MCVCACDGDIMRWRRERDRLFDAFFICQNICLPSKGEGRQVSSSSSSSGGSGSSDGSSSSSSSSSISH